jgi:ParB-like chromosome segregation protein Spo0J
MTIQDANPNKPATADKAGPAEPVKKHEYEYHPIANVFPLMEGEEFKALVQDIKANGLREPITVFEGKILDGRNRYRAVLDAGHRLKDQDFKPYIETKPLEFVISANVHRRHLNESQRAVVAAKLVTTKLGDNQHIRREGRPIDQPTAAEMLNVSEKSVQRAKNVCDKGAPELQALVESGKVAVSAAEKLANKLSNKEDQTALASKGASAVNKAVKAWKQAEESAATQGSTSQGSDKIDELVNTLITKLKEMRAAKPENAEAVVADLMRRLQDADLWIEQKKKAA